MVKINARLTLANVDIHPHTWFAPSTIQLSDAKVRILVATFGKDGQIHKGSFGCGCNTPRDKPHSALPLLYTTFKLHLFTHMLPRSCCSQAQTAETETANTSEDPRCVHLVGWKKGPHLNPTFRSWPVK